MKQIIFKIKYKLKYLLKGVPTYNVYLNNKPYAIESINYLPRKAPNIDNCFDGSWLMLLMLNGKLSTHDLWVEGGKDDKIIEFDKYYYIRNGMKFYTASKFINQ